MAADRSANFVIKAKDAATGPLGKIGGAMGKLKGAAGTAFKAIAAGAFAAAGAIAGRIAASSGVGASVSIAARHCAVADLGTLARSQHGFATNT